MESLGARVYERLLEVHRELPFPFADYYELWLLDMQQRPLALLDSAIDAGDMNDDTLPLWRAGISARKHFRPSCNLSVLRDNCINPADYLTDYINRCTGPMPAAQWFYRSAAKTAQGLDGIGMDSSLRGRALAADEFPAFPLQEQRHDQIHHELIQNYHHWQAPWSLLLSDLTQETRQSLEQHARQQALVVDEQYRLCPDVIDNTMINAARVEAMMRRSLPESDHTDEVMSTFYIELNEPRRTE